MRQLFLTASLFITLSGLFGSERFLSAQQATPSSTITILVTDEKANLRAGPGTDYDLIGALANGQTALVTGRSAQNDWIEVEYPSPGQRAWLYAELVSLQGGALDSLPVLAPPPTPTLPPTPTGQVELTTATPTLVRLPTFTPPPPVSPVVYTAPVLESGRFPIAILIIGLLLFGVFAGVMAALRRNV